MTDLDPLFFQVDRHDPNSYTPNPHYEHKDREPGSGIQGTLFNVQQFPRGYGPARQRGITEAMGSVDVSKIQPPKFEGPDAKAQRDTYRQGWGRKLTETLKQSHIPTEHLAGVDFKFAGIKGQGVSAQYVHGVQSPTVRLPALWSRQGAEPNVDAWAVGHEIGHHVDLTLSQPSVHSEEKTPGGQIGSKEATADVYAAEHIPGATDAGHSPRDIESQAKSHGERGFIQGMMAKHAYAAQTLRLGGSLDDRWKYDRPMDKHMNTEQFKLFEE